MTHFSPSINVKRLLVKKGNKIIYDANFSKGVNVLSGCNGGGKTSVIQLLMYGLGYEIPNWKDESRKADLIYVGIEINENPLTLRRKNCNLPKQSMDIFFDSLDIAIQAPIDTWKNYPYSITSRSSFSQKLFSIMGIPEAKADANNNNITIHQLFRLLYSDQSNPSYSIFNIEPFDSAFKRESIGKYLLGLYDNELYDAKINFQKEDKALTKIVAKLQAVHSVVGKTSFSQDFKSIDEAKKEYLANIIDLNEEIIDLKENALLKYTDEKKTTEKCAVDSIKYKNMLYLCETEIQKMNFEIEDSKEFVAELNDKLCAINDSLKIGAKVPKIKFSMCPSCNKKLNANLHNCCHLCGSEDTSGTKNINLIKMKNEIDIQLKESLKILDNKMTEWSVLQLKRNDFRKALRQNISKTTATMTSLNAANEKKIYSLYTKIGEIEEKLLTLDKVAELHSSISELTLERDKSQKEVNRLKDLIEKKKYQVSVREPEVAKLVSEHLISILNKDIGAEKEFKHADRIDFDFASNTVAVNGKTAFSESGTVYLNNAFHLALLLTSLDKKYIRIPRFMVLDGIENGGMEDVRSSNFQKVLLESLMNYDVDYQIIFATKSISSCLNNPSYIVDRHYTENEKSLTF
ncbi:ATP-binding protein [Pseudoalteromonas sp. C2R02]|uniref:ATP-binding protein n=1 Tax=Pseudoalteromonas sp. C2R02 TaxID=2841565 RepID=UPI001C095089|nr:ATP-binding protein [Pseudoalteromonas sp. C2R02]MBU2969826.1 ATP-binding protein [Pseudoalteromonas sp. C2R02]